MAGPERGAEIAMQRGRRPAQILDNERLIEAYTLAQLRHRLWRHLSIGAEHDGDRVARNEPDHQEDDDRDADHHHGEVDEPIEQKPPQHGMSAGHYATTKPRRPRVVAAHGASDASR